MKSNKTIEMDANKTCNHLFLNIFEKRLNVAKQRINQFKPITNGTPKILRPNVSPYK